MPFKSQAQRRLFYAKARRGEISKKTVKEWEAHTPKSKLPERVKQAEPPPPKGVSAEEWDRILQGLPKKTKNAYYLEGVRCALDTLT